MTLLSGEAEYTTAKSLHDYPTTNIKVEDSAERLGVGLRSTFPFNPYLGVYLRACGRAVRGETIVTVSGVSETKDNPLQVEPYAGSGFIFAFGSNIGANAGVAIIRNAEGKYDAQYTLGLSARFGKL